VPQWRLLQWHQLASLQVSSGVPMILYDSILIVFWCFLPSVFWEILRKWNCLSLRNLP
jgi:hypothetical protein